MSVNIMGTEMRIHTIYNDIRTVTTKNSRTSVVSLYHAGHMPWTQNLLSSVLG